MNILTGNVIVSRIWEYLKKTLTPSDLPNYSVAVDSPNDNRTYRVPLDELRIALMNSGLYDYRGEFDASVNLYPSSGGSGTGGLILKANIWIISVGGTIDGNTVIPGQTLLAKIDNPGQTSTNWAISLAGGGSFTQVQSDWSQTNNTLADYIKNKPTIPSIVGLLDETAHDLLDHTGLTGIPSAFDLSTAIHAATAETAILDADEVPFWKAVGTALRKITFANLKAALKAYFDTFYLLHKPTTEPVISTGTMTLDCANYWQAMFEGRTSSGTLVITDDFTIALSNNTDTKLISLILTLTGTNAITFPSDVICTNPSTKGAWVGGTHILTLVNGSNVIIRFNLIWYATSSKWLLEVGEEEAV